MRTGPFSPLGIALFTLLLYGGPILAGLSAAPLTTLPVFAAFFLLYIVATRHLSPQTRLALAQLGGMAVMQCVLVAICYAIGSAVARLTGPVSVPVWLPIALTGLASLTGAWRYRNMADIDQFATEALETLATIDANAAFTQDTTPPDTPVTRWLDSLPDSAPPAQLSDLEDRLARHADMAEIADVLLPRTDHADQYLLLALRLFARPDVPADTLSAIDLEDLFDEAHACADAPIAKAALALAARLPDHLPQDTRAALTLIATDNDKDA